MFFRQNKKNNNKKFNTDDPFVSELEGVKHNKLDDSSYRMEWTENVFLSAQGGREVVGKSFDMTRVKWIGLGFGIFLMIIFARVGWLQVAKGEYYGAMAEGNRVRVKNISPQRGMIYDRDRDPLVRNVANFVLYLVPGDLPEEKRKRDAIVEEVVGILDSSSVGPDLGKKEKTKDPVSAKEVKEQLNKIGAYSSRAWEPLFITDDITYKQAMRLHLKSKEWGGVVLSDKQRREYILNINMSSSTTSSIASSSKETAPTSKALSLSHVLGYTGKINKEELDEYGEEYSPLDYVGKTGIEGYWEGQLKGEKGKKKVVVDALGKEERVLSRTEAKDGNGLVLSLDAELQAKTEQVLKKSIEEIDSANAAAAVAMDPDTGRILSLVSVPSFNNNFFAQGITSEQYKKITDSPSNPLFNRAVSGEYPPGSIFKPIMAAAGLQEGIIDEHTSFKSTGGIRVGQWFFSDWKAGGHGITDVRKAIAESVNTFFYYLGGGYNDFEGLGWEKIVEYARKFGLGSPTKVDLPVESDGFLPTENWKQENKNRQWYIGDTYHLSIGQGYLLVTPIQVADYTSAFANKGTLYRPSMVKNIVSPQGKTVKEVEPEVWKQGFIEKRKMGVVREGMRQAVTQGSCRRLYDLEVKAAGKTGTAQSNKEKEPHAWFTGFAPYKDPEIVLTVMVKHGGGSAEVAVPVAKEIFKWYFKKKGERKVE